MSTPTPRTKASIEFSNQEASVLLELINIAIKAQGLQVAENGVVLFKKINAAFEPPKDTDVLQ